MEQIFKEKYFQKFVAYHLDRFSTFLIPLTSLRSLSEIYSCINDALGLRKYLMPNDTLLAIFSRSDTCFACFLLIIRTSFSRLCPNACKISLASG